MKRSGLGLGVAAAAAAVVLFAAMAEAASAHYPPPTGNLTVTTSSSTAAAGSSVSVSVTAVDYRGAVLPGLSCDFGIISQPGNDATVDAGPKTTDENGVATSTLNAGSTAGTVVVGVECGELSSQVAVLVTAAALPVQGPQEQPVPDAVQLPSTGMGPIDWGFYGLNAVIALFGIGAAAVIAGSVLKLKTRRVRDDS